MNTTRGTCQYYALRGSPTFCPGRGLWEIEIDGELWKLCPTHIGQIDAKREWEQEEVERQVRQAAPPETMTREAPGCPTCGLIHSAWAGCKDAYHARAK